MVRQIYIDRILESENLTDELEDSEAKWLLNWGIAQVNQVIHGIKDKDQAAAKVTVLIAVMRKINRIAGWYQQKEPEDLAFDLEALRSLFADAFGQVPGPSENDYLIAARQVKNLTTTQEIILFLTSWGRSPTSFV